MLIETLFPDIQYVNKEKKQKAEPKPKKQSAGPKPEYKPPVFIGQNLYIKPSYIVSIPEFYSENKGLSIAQIENQENLLDNKQGGELSRKAVQQLRNSINWLCLAAKDKRVWDKKANRNFKFKVNFVTLTLPDTDKPIRSNDLQKQILNPFLTYMRKYHGLKNYVWRLEFQANGKLHVHLTTDTFLHLAVIRETWNRLLDKNNYLDHFYKKHGHKDPNSTDVHATKKIKNLAGYLSKYMSKKGAAFQYPLKTISEKIEVAAMAGLGEKQISKLLAIKKNVDNKKVKPLGVMDFKAWYMQRINFWNCPFNPRPIQGRIWSCSTELSRANKIAVHVPASDCKTDLNCLFNPEIEYKELFTKQPEFNKLYPADHAKNNKRKIGEVYFLKAKDWLTKINGVVRKTFDDTIRSIQDLQTVTSFELDYG